MSKHLWNDRYKKEGHIWGDNPSPTAKIVSGLFSSPSKILEIGCGYGRDIYHLVGQGHIVHGIEPAAQGLNEAQKQLKRFIRKGKVNLFQTDFLSASLGKGEYAAIYAHRVIHLIEPGLMPRFAAKAHQLLPDKGYLVTSARNIRGFSPDQMRWTTRNIQAEYTIPGRKGHIINFWGEEKFKQIFSSKFNTVSFYDVDEVEAASNQNKVTPLTIMVAQKKPG